jgi:hypothetical protein
MLKYKRKSGSIIELKDTPEMAKFAASQGFQKLGNPKKQDKVVKHDRNGK